MLTLEARYLPKDAPYKEQRDANSPLILRVSSSGAKTFWVRTRIAGKGDIPRVLYSWPGQHREPGRCPRVGLPHREAMQGGP